MIELCSSHLLIRTIDNIVSTICTISVYLAGKAVSPLGLESRTPSIQVLPGDALDASAPQHQIEVDERRFGCRPTVCRESSVAAQAADSFGLRP
jgi:hypothetical protein